MHAVALVLLPGLDVSGVMFRPLLPNLPPNIRPIIVSYPPDDPKDYTQLLPLVLQSLPQGQEFLILGESFSGPLAIMAAATRPKGLIGVVLCASFVRNPLWLRPGWLRFLARPLAFKYFRSFTPIKSLLGAHPPPELRALLTEALALLQPRVLAGRVRSVLSVDVRDHLKSCQVPVLYLIAAHDRLVRAQNMRDVLAVKSETRVVPLEAPHLLLQTQPKPAANAINQFVSDLRSKNTV